MAFARLKNASLQKISAKNIILAAAITGTVQSVPWIILSLISNMYYNKVILPDDNLNTDDYGYWIYNYYLEPASSEDLKTKFIIHPDTFYIFMYFYSFLNFFWLLISCYIIWAMIQDKWDNVKHVMIGWTAVTFAIAAIDIILMSLIAADLKEAHKLFDHISETTITIKNNILYTSMGIVMTVAAKGYILWIVNVVFASVFVVLIFKMEEQEQNSMLPIIDAYASGKRPFSLYDTTEIDMGNWNEGFQQDDIFSPSRNPMGYAQPAHGQTFSPAVLPRNNGLPAPVQMYGPTAGGSRPAEAARGGPRLAKIGKANTGRRTPPQNVAVPHVPHNMPYIPPPDYTPPGSPNSKPKSVLRPKSNYVL